MKLLYSLFKVNLAEIWSACSKYSIDPAVIVSIGTTGAMLLLQGPGEVQDMIGQVHIGCQWVHASQHRCCLELGIVSMHDCEDGASFFTCVMHALGHGTTLHCKRKRNMFSTMFDIMPLRD